MSSVERLSLDGARVTLTMPDANWSPTYRSECRVLLDSSRERTLCSGSLAHSDWVASDLDFGPVTSRNEYAFQDGRLLIGSGLLPPTADGAEYLYWAADGTAHPSERWLAAWYGKSYSVHTQTAGGPEQVDGLISLLEQFVLSELPEGLTLQMRIDSNARIIGVELTQQLPGELLLSVAPLGVNALRRLPPWEGTRVAGGELFVASFNTHGAETDHQDEFLVLVGDSAVTYGIPLGNATEEMMISAMSTLKVTWESGATQRSPIASSPKRVKRLLRRRRT